MVVHRSVGPSVRRSVDPRAHGGLWAAYTDAVVVPALNPGQWQRPAVWAASHLRAQRVARGAEGAVPRWLHSMQLWVLDPWALFLTDPLTPCPDPFVLMSLVISDFKLR